MAKYKYISDGAYLPGIPARDLEEADWEELTAEQKKAVRDNAKLESAIYEEAKAGKKGD
jgi:hypothetical protein